MTPETILLDGRYELLGPVGRGGEAEVHRARDGQSGAIVAVRLLLPGQAAASTAGTAPEIAEFHPGWVRLLGAGRDPQRGAYQVFELLEGETFGQQAARGSLDTAGWLAFARESLEAVAALHAAGWVHGDLNADNFLQPAGPPRAWKLLELPFLRLVERDRRSALFGSIHTLAPEQLEGRAAEASSDVYALGCLYYYGAGGGYPHGGNSREIAIGRLRFAPAPLRDLAPGLPAALADWTMTLLERDPGRRPEAAEAARRLLAIA